MRLVPVLGRAALSTEYFGLVWWGCALAIPVAIYFKDRVAVQLSVVVLAFVSIYALHARHKAFAAGATVEPAEMVRYVFVASPLAVVLVGRCLSLAILARETRLWKRANTARWSAGLLVAFGAAATGRSLYEQRLEMAGDELENRTQPLAHHSGAQLKDTIFITPYVAALVAAGGQQVITVDPRVADQPEVVSWLNLKIKDGAKIIVDRN